MIYLVPAATCGHRVQAVTGELTQRSPRLLHDLRCNGAFSRSNRMHGTTRSLQRRLAWILNRSSLRPPNVLCRRAIGLRARAPGRTGPCILAVVDSSPSGGSDNPNAVPDGSSDRDQTGSADSPREPIGGLPGCRQGRFEASLYPYQPQQAWLQGQRADRRVQWRIGHV